MMIGTNVVCDVVGSVVIVSVDRCPAATGLTEKDAVAPLGSPDMMLRVMGCDAPDVTAVTTEVTAVPPGGIWTR